MADETVNVAEAKKHFSELLGQVAFGKKHILITKRGKPMARLVPVDETNKNLGQAKGWLDNDDPFFDQIDRIVRDRIKHTPRVLKEFLKYRNRIKTGAGKIEDDIKQARQHRLEKYR